MNDLVYLVDPKKTFLNHHTFVYYPHIVVGYSFVYP